MRICGKNRSLLMFFLLSVCCEALPRWSYARARLLHPTRGAELSGNQHRHRGAFTLQQNAAVFAENAMEFGDFAEVDGTQEGGGGEGFDFGAIPEREGDAPAVNAPAVNSEQAPGTGTGASPHQEATGSTAAAAPPPAAPATATDSGVPSMGQMTGTVVSGLVGGVAAGLTGGVSAVIAAKLMGSGSEGADNSRLDAIQRDSANQISTSSQQQSSAILQQQNMQQSSASLQQGMYQSLAPSDNQRSSSPNLNTHGASTENANQQQVNGLGTTNRHENRGNGRSKGYLRSHRASYDGSKRSRKRHRTHRGNNLGQEDSEDRREASIGTRHQRSIRHNRGRNRARN